MLLLLGLPNATRKSPLRPQQTSSPPHQPPVEEGAEEEAEATKAVAGATANTATATPTPLEGIKEEAVTATEEEGEEEEATLAEVPTEEEEEAPTGTRVSPRHYLYSTTHPHHLPQHHHLHMHPTVRFRLQPKLP